MVVAAAIVVPFELITFVALLSCPPQDGGMNEYNGNYGRGYGGKGRGGDGDHGGRMKEGWGVGESEDEREKE
ncbi:hypothetical protein RIF29_32997 [Crotalaria pallida]|uniref:Glycine-rich protein n=1 Tax=Crotalaria pallida TaxID=3830 RepID=A0AAN9E7V1_CROPI